MPVFGILKRGGVFITVVPDCSRTALIFEDCRPTGEDERPSLLSLEVTVDRLPLSAAG